MFGKHGSNPQKRVWTLALLLALSVPAALAQSDPTEEEKNKNGFMPTGTYAGPNTTVNLQNGGLIVGIPLVSLPGRAGHDLNVTLSYNSKQLAAEYNGDHYVARWFNEGPTVGRWVLNVWPSLKEEVPGSLYYFTTPDGGVHKLSSLSGGGIESTDSLNIRYVPSTRRVEFLSGGHFDFSDYDSSGLVYHRDRHGNEIVYHFEFWSSQARPFKVTDTCNPPQYPLPFAA